MKSCSEKFSPEFIRMLVRYDPETGKLYWKERDDRKPWVNARWNRQNAGKEAFATLHGTGYLVGHINRTHTLRTHRVAWVCHYGEWPDGLIDHINHDKTDNRLCNLRVVGHLENCRNKSLCRTNTSGVNGVTWHKGRWAAVITVDGQKINLGRFHSIEEASHARKVADRRHGFSPTHGEPLTSERIRRQERQAHEEAA
jgi:hypothetical protein